MQRLLAITGLTLKSAFRYRLVLVLAVLLLGAVVVLPLIIKDDGTARGFTQILLTYTLSAITILLGFATLWLACGTLARDVEECQMQMVAVKPIARWQIWLGKWLGIMTLNALLLGLAGGAVYVLLQWRAQKLPAEQQQILRDEVLVARGSARMPMPDIEPVVEKVFNERLKQTAVASMDRNFVRQQIREQVKHEFQLIRSGMGQRLQINLGLAKNYLRDQPLFLRTRFTSTQKSPSGTFTVLLQVGVPETSKVWRQQMSLAPDTSHEFPIPPNLFDENGTITIDLLNPNDADLLFQLEDGMEVLYREGGFGLNFARGIVIIFFWLALLAALGLAAASFLSFPVAAFLSLGVLVVGLSSGTLSQALEEGSIWAVNHETGVADKKSLVDWVALPVFRVLLKLVNLVQGFSPIDSLSTGRSITWEQLGLAFVQILLLMAGIFSLIGIIIFTRRELATAQGTQ